MKTCTHCHETKDPAQFSKDRYNRDGLQRHCKTCQAGYNFAYQHERFHPYTAEELLFMGPDHRLEALRDHTQKNLGYDDFSVEMGVPVATLHEWVNKPPPECEDPRFDPDVMDLAMRRVLEKQLAGGTV